MKHCTFLKSKYLYNNEKTSIYCLALKNIRKI